MGKSFRLQTEKHKHKIIHDGGSTFIMIHSVQTKDGLWSRNTLVKAEKKDDGKNIYRGLNLDDLVIVKKNWGKILKAMVE